MFLDFLWGGKKWYKLSELNFWLVVIILAVFITLLALLNVFIVKCLKTYFLNKRLDKAVPKDFPTSFDVEKRYQNISYHCKILTELLNVNKKYTFCWFRMFSGGAYAYRDILRARFTDLFDYLKEVIVSDYSKYKGFDLPSEEIYKIRTKLKKSFVNRYHKLRTYDALDTFAAYSEMLVGLLIDINNECKARCVKESHGAVQDMLNDIQTYYREYNRYKGIRKKVFTTQTTHYSGNTSTTITHYHTMGHKRLDFMNFLKDYIVFIDNFYNHMQIFYEYDTINNPV